MTRLLFRSLLLPLILLSQAGFAQPDEEVIANKTLTATEVYELINQHRQRGYLTFRKCRITYTEQDDDYRFAIDDYSDFERASGHMDFIGKPMIYADVTFDECSFNAEFNRPVIFTNIYFKGKLTLDNCSGYGLNFDRCVFWDGIASMDIRLRYLKIERSQFYHSFEFNDDEVIQVELNRCQFVRNHNSVAFGLEFSNRNTVYDFIVDKCEFLDQSESHVADSIVHENNLMYLSKLDASHFKVTNSVFDCSLVFDDFSVERSFVFKNNQYNQKVIFSQAPNIPIDGSVFLFSDLFTVSRKNESADSLKTKIGVIKELSDTLFLFYRYDSDWEYAKDQVRPWIDVSPEKQIIPVYSKLLAVYNATSDIESYNLCFRQMKRIEKTASKIRWETRSKFIDWFRWKMDIFLEKFSAYGTDPVLSLFNSFYVICLFALIYVIFPSEEDNLRFHNLQQAIQKYIHHFSNRQKEFFTADELYERDLEENRLVKKQMDENIGMLPPVVSFFSMPFYYVSYFLTHVRHRIRSVVKFNIYQDWAELTARGRFKTSFVISLNMVGFLLWGLVMRIINSLTLSLNAFVTLGYGGMEAKGVSRYVCIVEGLIGWFLLSIFSVSLISQILQ